MHHFRYLLILFILATSCKTKQHTYTTEGKADAVLPADRTLPVLTASDTLFEPNAPKRITRNIKLDREGGLLIAAYDDIIRYSGDSFTRLAKPEGVQSWYAFDVLEDRHGNIWIASDQSGAFRIDSKTGTVTNFTPEDGLGHLRNMVVYEDSAGSIWIGGQGGLSKYDGTGFTNFTTEDGLPHNDINTLLEDSEGTIWIGTRGNAGFYDGTTFTELKNGKGDSFFNVWSIIEDQSQTIWLVDSHGLWKYHSGTYTHTIPEVWKIFEDAKGDFWFTGMLKGGGSTLKRFETNPLIDSSSDPTELFKSDKMFFGIVEDKEGNIWVGGGDGIWRYRGASVEYYTGIRKND